MLIGLIMVLMLIIDCVAFHMISKDDLSDTKQKILQSLLVFFVPGLGAMLVILVNKAKPSSTGKYPEKNEFDVGDISFRPRNKNENEFDVNDD